MLLGVERSDYAHSTPENGHLFSITFVRVSTLEPANGKYRNLNINPW